MTEPVVLTLSPVDLSDIESLVPQSDASSRHSSGSQDTILIYPQDESGTSYRSKPWPTKFEVQTFSYDVDLILVAENKAYEQVNK